MGVSTIAGSDDGVLRGVVCVVLRLRVVCRCLWCVVFRCLWRVVSWLVVLRSLGRVVLRCVVLVLVCCVHCRVLMVARRVVDVTSLVSLSGVMCRPRACDAGPVLRVVCGGAGEEVVPVLRRLVANGVRPCALAGPDELGLLGLVVLGVSVVLVVLRSVVIILRVFSHLRMPTTRHSDRDGLLT